MTKLIMIGTALVLATLVVIGVAEEIQMVGHHIHAAQGH